MGFLISKPMQQIRENQQEVMAQMQQAQFERQLAMQNVMRERMMAMQVARTKEMFNYFTGPVGAVLLLVCMYAAATKKNPAFAVPTLPIGGLLEYQYDLAYGNKLRKIQRYAEKMLIDDPDLFNLPLGEVTLEEVEKRRQTMGQSHNE